MGTDIHYVFQKKTQDSEGKESWETLNLDYGFHFYDGDYEDGEYYIGRHYLLFAVLAGVRNGYGFAGTYRHEPLIPIAEGRGLPDGITSDWFDNDVSYGVYGYGYVTEDKPKSESLDLGDHSFNWLLGSEILDWFKEEHCITQVGILGKEEYFKWTNNGYGEPNSYCNAAFGSDIVLFDETNSEESPFKLPFKLAHTFERYANVTHVRVSWKQSINESLSKFKGMVQKVVDEHGEIRMVMGFDS